MRPLLIAILFSLSPSTGWTGEKRDAADLARRVAPFVDDMTFAIIHLDAQRFEVGTLFKLIADMGIRDKSITEAESNLTKVQTLFREMGGRDVIVLLNWDAPRIQEDPVIVVPLQDRAKADALAALFSFVPRVKTLTREDTLVVTTERNLERVQSIKPRERKSLLPALSAFEKESAKAIFLPPPIVIRTFTEVFPEVPPILGGGPTRELGSSLQWVGLGLNEKLELTFRLQTDSEKAAGRFQGIIKHALEIPLRDPNVQLLLPLYAKFRERLLPTVKGKQLVLQLDDEVMKHLIGTMARQARAAAARQMSANNLRQIGLAFHVYHDARKALPAAFTRDAEGRPLLSWRVHLLPYMEQEHLYKQFKLDEPWDSPHNKKLIPLIPRTYASPLAPDMEKGKTTYLVPTGRGSIFEGNEGIQLLKIPDGTSNTILVLEVIPDRAVIWTKPDDFPIDPKDLLKGLVLPELKGFHAGFADGSVRFLGERIRTETLRALFTAAGGEAIDPDVLNQRKK